MSQAKSRVEWGRSPNSDRPFWRCAGSFRRASNQATRLIWIVPPGFGTHFVKNGAALSAALHSFEVPD